MPVVGPSRATPVPALTAKVDYNQYLSGELSVVGTVGRTTTTPRGILWCHGTGGTAANWTSYANEYQLWGQVLEKAGGRYVLVAGNFGGAATYGNDTSLSAVGSCITWAQSIGAIASGKVALAGHSMGLMTAANYAYRHATAVAGIAMVDGACYPSDWFDNGIPGYQTAGFVQSELNNAYGGDWASNKTTRCPKLLADGSATLRGIPLAFWRAGDASAGDGIKVIPDASVAAFIASYGANAHSYQPNTTSDHETVHRYIPPQDVIAFLDSLTWT